MNVNVSDQQGNTLVKRLWLNEEQALSVLLQCLQSLFRKDLNQVRGTLEPTIHGYFFCVLQNKTPQPQSARTVGGTQSLHTRPVRIQH